MALETRGGTWRGAVAGVLVGMTFLVGAASLLRAQDTTNDGAARVGEIHTAIAAAGIPLDTVRYTSGRYELVFKLEATSAQRADGQRICDELRANPTPRIVVDNVQDALVVLRFEPNNASALQIVGARYEQLKQAAR